jgi:hypothetical protein
MRLFNRRRDGAGERTRTLAEDAAAMRAALDRMQAQERLAHGGGRAVDLRAIVADLLEGEVAAPTPDVDLLLRRDTDARDFYEREIAPSWDGRDEEQRAVRLEGFLDLARTVDEGGGGLPEEMAATMRLKALLLAWAFDETYGYIAQLAAGEEVAEPA